MGYRSEITSAIAMPSKDFVVSTIAKMLLENVITPKDLEDGYNQTILDRTRVFAMKTEPSDYQKLQPDFFTPPYKEIYVWEYQDSEIKWYAGTPWVTHWEYILQEANNNGLPHLFYRIGEDSDDVERESSDSDYGLLREYLLRSGVMGAAGIDAAEDESKIISWVSQYEQDLDMLREWYQIYTCIEHNLKGDEVRVPLKEILSTNLRGNADESDNESTVSAA